MKRYFDTETLVIVGDANDIKAVEKSIARHAAKVAARGYFPAIERLFAGSPQFVPGKLYGLEIGHLTGGGDVYMRVLGESVIAGLA